MNATDPEDRCDPNPRSTDVLRRAHAVIDEDGRQCLAAVSGALDGDASIPSRPSRSHAQAPASARLLDGSTSLPLTLRHTWATPVEPYRYPYRVQSITVRDIDFYY